MRWIPFTNENIPNIHCMFYLFWGRKIWKLCQRIECHMIDSVWLSVCIQYTQHGSYNSFKGNVTNAESRMTTWTRFLDAVVETKWLLVKSEMMPRFTHVSFVLLKVTTSRRKRKKNYVKRDKKLVAEGIVNERKRVAFGL